jgi:DNA polymerase-3 subunit gamma/tau
MQLSQKDREQYEKWNALYSTRQCLTILDVLIESQQQMKSAQSLQIVLEATLLKILRTKMHLSAEELVSRLIELEHRISSPNPPQSIKQAQFDSSISQKINVKSEMSTPPAPQPPSPPNPQPNLPPELPQQPTPSPSEIPLQPPAPPNPQPILPPELPQQPTPSPSEIPQPRPPQPAPPKETPKAQLIESFTEKGHTANHQARYDTLMRFAAVELEGTLKKK